MAGAAEQGYMLDSGMGAPTLTGSSLAGNRIVGGGQGPHHGVIGLVLLAVLLLVVLDRAGFRFAVTAGKR